MDSWTLFRDLYPIQRSLLGAGVERSLDAIHAFGVPVRSLQLASGTQCGSWTIPDAWRVGRAQLRSMKGAVLLDFEQQPHCLWQYSTAFKGTVPRDALLGEHMSSVPGLDGAIPLNVTYYKRRWGFSAPDELVTALKDDAYEVDIESSFEPGRLTIGLAELAGTTSQTVILDAVISCASLANNLSGAVALAELYRRLAALPSRRMTYRFVWSPETLGPIALAYHFPQVLRGGVAGLNLQNLADRGRQFTLKRSRAGRTVMDRALEHVLRSAGVDFRAEDYNVRTGTCGNEKAYNSLGIEFPMTAFRRTQLGGYPEYDTSLDDMQFVARDKFEESSNLVWRAITAIELNRTFVHTFKGEPFLTGYGLFPGSDEDRVPYDQLMGFADGKEDLLALADRSALPVEVFKTPVEKMLRAGLLREIPE
jgi:aminopeptidase-like protein